MKGVRVRKGSGQPGELDKLYGKLVYWLYDRRNVRHARPFADRLEAVLKRYRQTPEAIFIEECRSLVCEAKGDLENAIKHRENEIRLIRRLHLISQNTPDAKYVFDQYDYTDLSDRLDLLAMLYHDGGDLNKAISTLLESKHYCQEHGIGFDGEDILREYLGGRKHVTTDVELLIEANGRVFAKNLQPRTRAGSTSKAIDPGMTPEVVGRSAGRYGEKYEGVGVSDPAPNPAPRAATGLPYYPKLVYSLPPS
jgi:hypothetical protein